jgi:hypothetical protein
VVNNLRGKREEVETGKTQLIALGNELNEQAVGVSDERKRPAARKPKTGTS